MAVICIDAYSSLFKARELLAEKSTDAFLWLIEAATQFENLGELDNTIMACVRGIEFAKNVNLVDSGYELFKYARNVYEQGISKSDPSLRDPSLKSVLAKAGLELIAEARRAIKGDSMRDMQAELKATLLGGASLRRAEKGPSDVIMVDGRQLYTKKLSEYKDGAETFVKSGVVANAITFTCMAALAELMLGRPKEGIEYLTRTAAESGFKERFNEDPCFRWTKLIFKALVNRDRDAIDQARKDFLMIPWSFKDDKEFARRVMESVYRRIVTSS
ncbi:MAG: hypothetical protein QXQ81_09185 [Candidatus Thorarchaeota archaeon]